MDSPDPRPPLVARMTLVGAGSTPDNAIADVLRQVRALDGWDIDSYPEGGEIIVVRSTLNGTENTGTLYRATVSVEREVPT